MAKISDSLLSGPKQALAHARGEKSRVKVHKVKVPKQVDVKSIREKLHLTRQAFADRFGFSIRTLEKWEQGVRQPDGAARAYLVVIEKNPKAVIAALG